MAFNLKKTVSIALICIAIANLLLLGFRAIKPLQFWIVIAAVALAAFFISKKKS